MISINTFDRNAYLIYFIIQSNVSYSILNGSKRISGEEIIVLFGEKARSPGPFIKDYTQMRIMLHHAFSKAHNGTAQIRSSQASQCSPLKLGNEITR